MLTLFAILQIHESRAARIFSAIRAAQKFSSEQKSIEANKMVDGSHLTRSHRS